SYRRKEDSRAFQNKIGVGLKNGLSLPAGLNAGQGITLLIDRETVAYSKLNSFDDLPIPFRCVATDLVTGKEEVFGQGSLPRALRATMSIPGLFSPVRDGEKDYLHARDARKQSAIPVPQFVKVEGTDANTAKHMEEFLASLKGKPIENEKLDKLLTRLTAFGKFDWVGYQIAERDGQSGLLITVHEKNYAPPYLQLGFEVDGSESGDVNFTQAARLTVQDKAGYRSEWRTDILFGNTYGIASELYRPLTATSHWFIAPRGSASDTNFKIYRMNDPLSEYRVGRASIGVDFGFG